MEGGAGVVWPNTQLVTVGFQAALLWDRRRGRSAGRCLVQAEPGTWLRLDRAVASVLLPLLEAAQFSVDDL